MDRPNRPQKIGFELPVGTDPASVRRRIEAMEQLLERSFTIPGVNYSVGLDAVAGLVPVVGDLITAAMGAYLQLITPGILAVLAVFAFSFNPSFDFNSSLPDDVESTKALKTFQAHFAAGASAVGVR